MSRRKAFETSLTSGPSSTPSPKPGNTSPKKAKPVKAAVPPAITPPEPAEGPMTRMGPTAATASIAADTVGAPESDQDDVCFICAEPIQFWSVGVCGHRTCHVCAIRLRVFYKYGTPFHQLDLADGIRKKECTFCKTSTPSLLFSRSLATPFPAEHHIPPSDPDVIAAAAARADKLPKGQRWDAGLILPGTLDVGQFTFNDEKLGVVFEDEDMMETTLLLLRYNCPYPDCAHMASDWPSLERHTVATHGLALCSLCRRQLSRFAHEQVLYPPHLLPLHDPSLVKPRQKPPRPRGPVEEEMVKGWETPHPLCEFCHEAFFGPDELFAHMRGKHEECFVCRGLGEKDVYFKNYDMLEQHFNADHFPCTHPACLEKKFVVFPSVMDLRAHMVNEHGQQMSARDRAQARQLPIDFSSSAPDGAPKPRSSGRGFSIGPSGQTNGSAGPSRHREAPPHQQISQPSPMTSAQQAQVERQVRRDRQEETSKRRRQFETGLTGGRSEEEAVQPDSGWATPRKEVDEITADRHAALITRVEMLTNSAPNKLTSFRSAIRQFRNAESGAKDLVDTVFNVLDRDVEATTGVLREVAGLFDHDGEKEKMQALLAALNAFRQRGQFPGLPAAPTAMGSNYAGITSGAILNAKRSTQTHRKGGTTVWDRVEAAAGAPRPTTNANGRYVPGSGAAVLPSAFPSLAAPSSSGLSKPGSSSSHSTPWASGGAGSTSKTPPALTGPLIRSVNYPTPAATKSGKPKPVQLNNSAFPSLPASSRSTAEERKALFSKPNAREETIRRITGGGPAPAATNGWGKGQGGEASADMSEGVQALEVGDEGGDAGGAGAGGGKKKGKGKQLLFTVSARP